MRVALMQMAVTDDEDMAERFRKAGVAFEQIERLKQVPDLIIFPELWGCGFQNFSHYRESAQTLKGDTWQFMSGWAKRLKCFIHGGSFVEKQPQAIKMVDNRRQEMENYFNTSVLFDREGREAGIYRKINAM